MTAAALRLVVNAATPGQRRAVFGADDDLDDAGRQAAGALAGGAGSRSPLGRAGLWLAGPAPAAVQTARAAGREPAVDPALADCDYGRWAGRSLTDVAAAEPDAVGAWLSDPHSAPHGGESVTALIGRVATWLDARADDDEPVVAFTHAAVVRAALVAALGLPAAGFWQLDVAPLAVLPLRRRAERWVLHLPAAR